MSDTIAQTLDKAHLVPKSVSVGDIRTDQISVDDLIKLDGYQAGKRAAAAGVCPVRYSQVIPGGNAE